MPTDRSSDRGATALRDGARERDQGADRLAASLFSEVFIADQLSRSLISRALPRGMQISHFSVLNLLAHVGEERTPAQLAEAFHVTRGAMTNTLSRLEWAGHVHIRPDWDDARRKFVSISPSGRAAREAAIAAFMPLIGDVVRDIGADRVRAALPVLRELRRRLGGEG
ncbi:MarR family transcriptional regulator [Paracoccus sp. TK19116]|uniref:MarR family transcriptional regulator n=1 Tax=Paracoccus albicereus TaxID=2922394 RepID=A0ABT1MRH1_9RHOB|nr:MarR family transcriptional regulator [Paracoccus albicereus]MCQ0970903.1 MarR family transcriptional regulator [Paracoccus albicereus]